jgi:hypothetical protein
LCKTDSKKRIGVASEGGEAPNGLAVGDNADGGMRDRFSEDGVDVGRMAQASNGVMIRSWFMGLVGEDTGGVASGGDSVLLDVARKNGFIGPKPSHVVIDPGDDERDRKEGRGRGDKDDIPFSESGVEVEVMPGRRAVGISGKDRGGKRGRACCGWGGGYAKSNRRDGVVGDGCERLKDKGNRERRRVGEVGECDKGAGGGEEKVGHPLRRGVRKRDKKIGCDAGKNSVHEHMQSPQRGGL